MGRKEGVSEMSGKLSLPDGESWSGGWAVGKSRVGGQNEGTCVAGEADVTGLCRSQEDAA